MIIIPAIDLKDGKCVRLLQGKKEEVTVYSDDPPEMAQQWVDLGARLLHVVDLDGAFTGEQKNLDIIREIRKAIHIPIELGGGIRDMNKIDALIKFGVDRIIIGTSAAEDPEMIREACETFPGKILIGIDARDGKVAVKGWIEVTELDAVKFAKQQGYKALEILAFDNKQYKPKEFFLKKGFQVLAEIKGPLNLFALRLDFREEPVESQVLEFNPPQKKGTPIEILVNTSPNCPFYTVMAHQVKKVVQELREKHGEYFEVKEINPWIRKGIIQTHGLFDVLINGKQKYHGPITDEQLAKMIEEELPETIKQ